MIHYSCDRCKKEIDTEIDLRYQVNIVTQVVLDGTDMVEQDVDPDHLAEVDELLQRVDDEECEQLCQDIYQSRRYDLCSRCFHEYKANPLGAATQQQVEFSEN